MERVKITQEQAKSIEKYKDSAKANHEKYKNNHKCNLPDWSYTLLELSTSDFIDALFEGYEVEPEFKENDWVIRTSDAGWGHEKGKVFRIVERISSQNIHGDDGESHVSTSLKHATDEEIATEKQRREDEKAKRVLSELNYREKISLGKLLLEEGVI